MAIMQGPDSLLWFWIEVALAVLSIVGTWYFVIAGRDRPPNRQRRGEETVERYGDIEEDRAPIAKFLIWTYAGTAIWAVGYLVWTGINGLW